MLFSPFSSSSFGKLSSSYHSEGAHGNTGGLSGAEEKGFTDRLTGLQVYRALHTVET